MEKTMRTMAVEAWGGPERLRPTMLPIPSPGDGEVVVRLTMAAVNPADLMLRAGVFAAPMEKLGPPWVPGIDGVGSVFAVGAGVDLALGERVCVLATPVVSGRGTYAEYVRVSADSLVPAPANLDDAAAAGMLLPALAASLAVEAAGVSSGESLLVTGAAGAVGTVVMQLAAAKGVEVVAQCRAEAWPRLEALGATRHVDREELPEGVDALVDCAGLGVAAATALRPGGVHVALRAIEDGLRDDVTGERVTYATSATDRVRLLELAAAVGRGELQLAPVADVVPLTEAAAAHARLEDPRPSGRQVLEIR